MTPAHNAQAMLEARRAQMASVEARLLARKLRGLPPDEVALLTKTFVSAFLGELLRQGDIQTGAVLDVAHVSMDLVIERQRGGHQPVESENANLPQ